MPREPDREAVRVGGGERKLPGGDAEPSRELLRDLQRVLAREHERDALCRLLGHRPQRRVGGMARHRAGVAEAEVDVLDPVHVDEACALGRLDEHGKPSGPLAHPVHRHALEEVPMSAPGQLARPRMRIHEPRLFARVELGECGH